LNKDKAPLIEGVLALEQGVYRLLRPIVPREWLSVDLTMPQFKVLLFLFIEGPARMGVLASALGVSMTTVTGIIGRLVRQRLVVRRSGDEDRRIVVCELSVKGRRLIMRLWEQRQARVRSLLSRIATADLRLVSAGLEAILNAAKSEKTPATSNAAASKDGFS